MLISCCRYCLRTHLPREGTEARKWCCRHSPTCHDRLMPPIPERGRKLKFHNVMHGVRVITRIDNPISPRGDGNFPTYSPAALPIIPIDNPISPRGDGNSATTSPTSYTRAFASITPFPREGTETLFPFLDVCANRKGSITRFPREGTETRLIRRCAVPDSSDR